MTRRRGRDGRAPARLFAGALALGAAAAPGGCSNLSLIQANECGNGVIEPSEDCDGQERCGAAGTEQACRYVCEAHPVAPAVKIDCPVGQGYQCGADDICRRHSGVFETLSIGSTGTTRSVLVGDLNGDGCAEVARTTLRGSEITASSSREPGVCAASRQDLWTRNADAPLVTLPLLADLDGGGKLHLVTADRTIFGDGLFVYRPADTPALSALLHASTRLLEPDVTALAVRRDEHEALLLIAEGGPMGSSVALLEDPSKKATMLASEAPPGAWDTRAIAAGNLDVVGPWSAACDEVAIAVAGQAQILIYRTCDDAGAPTFAPLPGPTVTLAGGATVAERARIVVADQDGDGLLDLLVNDQENLVHVAYGLGDGSFHSSLPLPPPGSSDQQTTTIQVPDPAMIGADPETTFAVGDFDTSRPGLEIALVSCASEQPLKSPLCDDAPARCEAVADDIDGDGDDDIVSVTAQPELVIQRSLGDGRFHVEYLETRCAPRYLATGDVDGDGIADISFFDQVTTELPTSPEDVERFTALSVAYGNGFADPSPPALQGLLEQASALVAGRFIPGATGEQLYALQRLGGPGGGGPGAGPPGTTIALAVAESGRLQQAPFYFPAPPDPTVSASILDVEVRTMVEGRFSYDDGAASREGLAVITRELYAMPDPSKGRLWLLEIEEDKITLRPPDQSRDVVCQDCVLASLPAAGGAGDDLLLLGDGEILVYPEGALFTAEPERLPVGHRFSSLDPDAPADSLLRSLPRPALVGLGPGAAPMLVARATDGTLVGIRRGEGGGIESFDLELSCTPEESAAGCKAASFAPINLDDDDQQELVIAARGLLAAYKVDAAAKALVRIPIDNRDAEPPQNTDFTSVSAGDVDGDGVDDIVFVPSSTVLVVLRGKPVLE